jgi:hypothetical protein
MLQGLQRFHQSGQSHFLTFSCYRRPANFSSPEIYDLRTNPNGQPEIGKQETAAARRERSSTQVSVQSADANLGHRAMFKIGRTSGIKTSLGISLSPSVLPAI